MKRSGIVRRANAARAGPAAIDGFLAAERRRERLKALRCLPAATARTVEMIEGRVAVLLYDKALLDEEDILPASLLIFGKHPVPLVRQVGSRTFISPGELTADGGGVALLVDDAGEGLRAELYRADGSLRESHAHCAGACDPPPNPGWNTRQGVQTSERT